MEYPKAIENVARHIRENGPTSAPTNSECNFAFDAFCASSVLAVAFEKTKEEVIKDILRINLKAIRNARAE